ncbi:MAG: hypothetical protein WAL75_14805 [Terracidiphilus sp.]
MPNQTKGLLKWWLAMELVVGCAGSCVGQYRLIPGKIDESIGCMPSTPARICLGTGTAHCYALESTKDYTFGMEPKATEIGRLDGQPVVLFSAMFSGCGSGTLTDYSLLTVRAGEFVDLLPHVRLTNQSQHQLWSLPQVSKLPVLVTADFIWDFDAFKKSKGQEETHFAAHRYHVEAFAFDPKSGQYLQKVSFDTTNKYPGLDEVDQIEVVGAEKPHILAKLRSGPEGPQSK